MHRAPLYQLILITSCIFQLVSASTYPPNIVLFIVEDLGISDIRTIQGIISGDYIPSDTTHRTNGISDVAETGIYFERAYTGVSSSSKSSIYELLTGIPGSEYSVNNAVKSRNELYLPELLRAAGYNTFGTGDIENPSAIGFDYFLGYSDTQRFPHAKHLYEYADGVQVTTSEYSQRNSELQLSTNKAAQYLCNIYDTATGVLQEETRASALGDDCEFIPDVLHRKNLDKIQDSFSAGNHSLVSIILLLYVQLKTTMTTVITFLERHV